MKTLREILLTLTNFIHFISENTKHFNLCNMHTFFKKNWVFVLNIKYSYDKLFCTKIGRLPKWVISLYNDFKHCKGFQEAPHFVLILIYTKKIVFFFFLQFYVSSIFLHQYSRKIFFKIKCTLVDNKYFKNEFSDCLFILLLP